MPTEKGRSGGCLCGGVRYRVKGALIDVSACHCSQCRKTTGHFFASTTCSLEALKFENEETLSWYESSTGAHRGFCSRCGSSLFWQPDEQDATGILAGSLDQPTGLNTMGHIFVGEKADFYEISDPLPQFEKSSDGALKDDSL
ncbi:hypothetical protein LCGC14_0283960 [marine sediment metagenome]|uniref:CENP-V/GFA domain-containing protein n=1 Tax=marine sediment metagenome TaxID=412755 RepID=A0A0F9WG84_9ZZZZ